MNSQSGIATMDTRPQVHQRGFTLIEHLSALAILSILMMMAIPTYKDYRTRGKISEGISIVSIVLSQVEETYQITGVWPENNSTAGVDDPANFNTMWVNEIVVEHDTNDKTQIRVVYNNTNISGVGLDDDIIFKPIVGRASTKWDCTGGTIATYYRPARCRVSG